MDKDEIFLIKKLQFLIEILERYGVKVSDFEFFNEDKPYSVVLGFSEHDKVFEDKIAELENIINNKLGGWDKHGITYQEIMDIKAENQDLKKITKCYEDKIAELEKEVVNYKQAFEDKCKDYKSTSELLGKYQQENESLKKRVVELENFSCQAEQETESLVEKLKQRIAELESRETLELPFDALETANYLINATYERETNGFERTFHNLPDKVNSDRYTVDDLEQIAEHLLVYCKHNKESE